MAKHGRGEGQLIVDRHGIKTCMPLYRVVARLGTPAFVHSCLLLFCSWLVLPYVVDMIASGWFFLPLFEEAWSGGFA